MTKHDIVTRISNETGLAQHQSLDVLQRSLDHIAGALAKGEKVELRNFGVFEVKVRKAGVGRNPKSPGQAVPIPERAVVKFKPGKELRAEVIKLTPATVSTAQASPTPPANDFAAPAQSESERVDPTVAPPTSNPTTS
jgi:nucleoid DNA-binding protein